MNKGIRPTVITFDNEKDRLEFIKYAESTSKTDSVGMDEVRRMMRSHVRAERVSKK